MIKKNKQDLKELKWVALTLILLSSGAQASDVELSEGEREAIMYLNRTVENGYNWIERKIARPIDHTLKDGNKWLERKVRPTVNNPLLNSFQALADYVEDSKVYLERKGVFN